MHGDAISPYANQYGTGADEAWALGATGSSSVYVAVIDGGVQIDHPDLAANIWTNSAEIPGNGVDDDGNGYVDDIHGWDFYYGERVGLRRRERSTVTPRTWPARIGAQGGNGVGVAGVNWDVTIIPVKFMGGPGLGAGTYSGAVAALDYVTALKVDQGSQHRRHQQQLGMHQHDDRVHRPAWRCEMPSGGPGTPASSSLPLPGTTARTPIRRPTTRRAWTAHGRPTGRCTRLGLHRLGRQHHVERRAR